MEKKQYVIPDIIITQLYSVDIIASSGSTLPTRPDDEDNLVSWDNISQGDGGNNGL